MSKTQKALIPLILLFTLIGLVSYFPPNTTEPVSEDRPIIILEQSMARGYMFEASIYESGKVVFVSNKFAFPSRIPTIDKTQEDQISKSDVAYLTEKISELDIFNKNTPTEGLVVRDGGTVSISLFLDGETQTISHIMGDPNISQELVDFETELSAIIDVQAFLDTANLLD